MTCQGPSRSYSMILSSLTHSSGINAPFQWKCFAQSCCVLLAQSCLSHLLCAHLFWVWEYCIQDANPNSTLSTIVCLSFQHLLFTSIFLCPETFFSNFRISCHHFCESSFVPQLSFCTFPQTSINSFCCFHHVFPPMDHHSFLLSELTSAFHPLGVTVILSLRSLYLPSHGFVLHSQAPYQLCCAVFLLTSGWK